MSQIIFTLLKSPFEKNELENMNVIAGNNDKGVVLFQDAIYYATVDRLRNELLEHNFKIYAIEDELDARGYGSFSEEGVDKIGYTEAVELIMEKNDKVISL